FLECRPLSCNLGGLAASAHGLSRAAAASPSGATPVLDFSGGDAMKHVHRPSAALAAATLLAVSGAAMGQAPAIDGTLDASYGPALWVNTQNPTGFGDNVQGNFPCSDFGSGM